MNRFGGKKNPIRFIEHDAYLKHVHKLWLRSINWTFYGALFVAKKKTEEKHIENRLDHASATECAYNHLDKWPFDWFVLTLNLQACTVRLTRVCVCLMPRVFIQLFVSYIILSLLISSLNSPFLTHTAVIESNNIPFNFNRLTDYTNFGRSQKTR